MMKRTSLLATTVVLVVFSSCSEGVADGKKSHEDSPLSCTPGSMSRFASKIDTGFLNRASDTGTDGMKWIPAGEFMMGAFDDEGRTDESPQHKVKLEGFWMDETEVTNAQFQKFVEATGYITTAEKNIDWNELKKQLPDDVPKPADSLLLASSLVFTPPVKPIELNNASRWWSWEKGANWKQPRGPGSNIKGKENYPVVHISWDDAQAYCKWTGKRLPTEAEWEYAAKGGLINTIYPWGNEDVERGKPKANTWQGSFPDRNTIWDGHDGASPVRSYAPNGFGLYDIAGNVWEWCSDWYDATHYQKTKTDLLVNPVGPDKSFDPMEPTVPKKVVRGGSFMCHASYCKGYRLTSRMKSSPDTGLEHTGFRCVKDS